MVLKMIAAWTRRRLRPDEGASHAADTQAIARELLAIATVSDPALRERLTAEIGACGTSALLDWLGTFRATVLLNIIYAGLRRDLALIPVFFAFAAVALGMTSADDGLKAMEILLAQARHRLRNPEGRAVLQRLKETGSPLAEELERLKDIRTIFAQATSVLERHFGTLVPATPENFDEAGYLSANPDIAADVAAKRLKSGLRHFLAAGEHEQRKLRLWHQGAASVTIVHPLSFQLSPESHDEQGGVIDIETADRRAIFVATARDAPMLFTAAADEVHDATATLVSEIFAEASSSGPPIVERRWSTGATYLASFPSAITDVKNGIVLFGGDQIWADSAFATLLGYGGHRRSPDMFAIEDQFAWITRWAEQSEIQSDVPVMLCCNWASIINFGHWLMNTLLSVYLVREELAAGQVRLLSPRLTDRQRAELLRMGAPADAIVETASHYVRCNRLIYPSPLTTRANMMPSSISRPFFAFVRERFAPEPRDDTPGYLYLARKGFPSTRRMTNEDELIALLEELGFSAIFPHEMTLAEQIGALSKARIVVGQFGAALWNVPFMPAGGTVIEIATRNYVSDEYLYASHLAGHRFVRILADPTPPVPVERNDPFTFEAPLDQVRTALQGLSGHFDCPVPI